MKIKIISLLLITLLILSTSNIFAQSKKDSTEFLNIIKSYIEISGQYFLSNNYTIDYDGNMADAFTLKRGYVTFKKKLNETFSLRFTQDKSKRLDYAMEKLELLNPINRLQQSRIDLNKTVKSLHDYYNRYLTRKQNEYVLSINKLELLNPLSIMKKGYSVVKIKNTVIKSVDEISIEDNIEILVSDGTLNARVTDKRKDE
jgi:exonuclease VII large subunit